MEYREPGVGGHDGRCAAAAAEAERRQPVSLALVLVGGELLDVLLREQCGVLPGVGSVDVEEGAQFQTGTPHVVERAGAARAAR